MSRQIWRVALTVSAVLLVLGAVLVAVAYLTGGSIDRVMMTTDITDLTKFMSRAQMEYYLSLVF